MQHQKNTTEEICIRVNRCHRIEWVSWRLCILVQLKQHQKYTDMNRSIGSIHTHTYMLAHVPQCTRIICVYDPYKNRKQICTNPVILLDQRSMLSHSLASSASFLITFLPLAIFGYTRKDLLFQYKTCPWLHLNMWLKWKTVASNIACKQVNISILSGKKWLANTKERQDCLRWVL